MPFTTPKLDTIIAWISPRKNNSSAKMNRPASTLIVTRSGTNDIHGSLFETARNSAVGVARLAGIQAAKRTGEWIPLCHPLAFDSVAVNLVRRPEASAVEITTEVKGTGKTGYEMEALVAASAAALALYDMCKAADKGIEIREIALLEKSGGKSGRWRRGATG